jgi:hypothetical protein
MKAIVCGLCFDIRALRGEGMEDAVSCECGNVTAWWAHPLFGYAIVSAKNRDKAKILGIDNEILKVAFSVFDFSPEKWRTIHDDLAASAKGYVFELRGCPFAIVPIGQTTDVRWADDVTV